MSDNTNMINLCELNTMALQSFAKERICLTNLDEVLSTFTHLKEKEQKFIILSGGSNTILPPELNASVISPTLFGQKILYEDDSLVTLEVMAGENWHELVIDTVTKGWYGLENLALIPGWVGACPVQNIGAYGVQVEDVILQVTAFHIPTLTWHLLCKQDCQFGYRDSLFKHEEGEWLITSVVFQLKKNPVVNVKYADVASVAQQLAEQGGRNTITPIDVMQAIIQIRQSKLPDTKELPNCGSFFKNPVISRAKFDELLAKFPNIIYYNLPDPNMVKLAGGWLIEQAGLKGKGIEPIFTHSKQALVLTNHRPCQASQADIQRTMQWIISQVQEKFSVTLEPEPVWIEKDGYTWQNH